MNPREVETLNAINKIKKKYPYAASMLIYTIIERELKQFLLDHRDVKSHSILNLSAVIEKNAVKT